MTAAALNLCSLISSSSPETFSAIVSPGLTPWASIGGCGAGGSGGSGGAAAKWVGKGVTGGLIDLQVLGNYSFGQSYQTSSLSTRASYKPTYTSTLGITIPVMSKSGLVQPQGQIPDRTEVTGGLGDITIDYSKALGMEGQYALNLGLTFPSGQSDIKRGADNEKIYLPSILQKGGGLYAAAIGLGYTKDIEKGILLFDINYNHPFALNFTGKNQYNQGNGGWNYATDNMSASDRNRFEYYFKPYGENDLGAFTPRSISIDAYYGNKAEEAYIYSFGLTFSAPLSVAWIAGYNPKTYAPIQDPDFQAWSASLNWGMEFSHAKYPVFIAVALPIHDKADGAGGSASVLKQWSGPDLKDLGQAWSFTIGIKSTLF